MGNLPLCVPKRGLLQFGDYTDITRGHFSLHSYRAYDMSFEDLRPILSNEDEWNGDGGDSATILGLEMDQESV